MEPTDRRTRPPAPLLATAAFLGACAAAPPAPATAPAPPLALAPPERPPERPARWLRAGGATSTGVPWGDERLVLLGGRRALLAANNTLRPETAPAPEPLLRVLRVPTTAGPLLLAQSAHAVYRLDDPLGAPVILARSASWIDVCGAGPGIVAVLGSGLTPRLLDARTAQLTRLPGLSEPRLLRALAFRDDAREGAVLLAGAGLWVTTDGGATFRRAVEDAPGTADRARALRVRGGAVFAIVDEDKTRTELEAEVDIAAGKLGPPRPAPAETQPLLGWIHDFGRGREDTLDDPLTAAAAGGVLLPDGRALVAGREGGVAHVDLETGALLDLARVAELRVPPLHNGECALGRAPRALWLGCDAHEKTWIWSLPLDGPALVPEPGMQSPSRVNGMGGWSTSLSGGVIFGRQVRRPDGSWWRPESAEGALADGRTATLRIPRPERPGEPAVPGPLQVVLTDAAGKQEALPPLRFYPEERLTGRDWQSTHLAVLDFIEEDTAGVLHFVMADHHEAFAVVQAPGREPTARAFTWARLHAGRGLAAAEGKLFASVDGGASWEAIPAPEGIVEASIEEVREIHAKYTEDSLTWTLPNVSEVGARIGGWLRLGWGPQTAIAASLPAIAGGVELTEAPRLPAKRLVCTRQAPAPARKAAPPPKPAKRGAEPGEPAASLEETPAGTTVMLRYPGREPFPVATIALRKLSVMRPNRDGVPLMLWTDVTRLVRILPLPPRGQPPRVPAALPLDGWTDVGASNRSVASLPVCGPRVPATPVSIEPPPGSLIVRVDGTDEPSPFTRSSFDLRVGPGGVCIASVDWTAPKDEPGFHYQGRYSHVRAELAEKRAEGRQAQARDRVDTLACALEDAPAPR